MLCENLGGWKQKCPASLRGEVLEGGLAPHFIGYFVSGYNEWSSRQPDQGLGGCFAEEEQNRSSENFFCQSMMSGWKFSAT